MVNIRRDPNTIGAFTPRKTKPRRGRPSITVVFTEELFDQIYQEASKREWTLAHVVRHLCEASIEGIE